MLWLHFLCQQRFANILQLFIALTGCLRIGVVISFQGGRGRPAKRTLTQQLL